jgi:hypothetical protein
MSKANLERFKAEVANWFHSKRRMVNLLVGLSAVSLYEIARAYYRPVIYANGINDYHIADTVGNSLGTVATVFVLTSLLGRQQTQDYFFIRVVTISVLVYEMAHPLLGKPIDPWDMAATIIAGFGCQGLYRVIHGRRPSSLHPDQTITT